MEVSDKQVNETTDKNASANISQKTSNDWTHSLISVKRNQPQLAFTGFNESAKITGTLYSNIHDSIVFSFNDGSLSLQNRWINKEIKVKVSKSGIVKMVEEEKETSLFFLSRFINNIQQRNLLDHLVEERSLLSVQFIEKYSKTLL